MESPVHDPEIETLDVYGASVHNLQNIEVSIPRNRLVVITGISGSGKSSLAFDTIYAEGQRRYMESLSAYARQFIGNMERPDVELITGLSPVISIEQKTTNKNPRSTVGTVTEIYDFLRLLYARVGEAYSYNTGEKMVRYTEEQILELIGNDFMDQKIILLAPLVRGRKGHYRELFQQIRKEYLKVRVDGELMEIKDRMQVDRYKIHDIEAVIDRISVNKDSVQRLRESLHTAFTMGKGLIMIMDHATGEVQHFSKMLMCPTTGISYEEPSPNTFSFNSPYGACPHCNGLGFIQEVDKALVIPDEDKTIMDGGIAPLGEYRDSFTYKQIKSIARKYKFSLDIPIKKIPAKGLNVLLFGGEEESFEVTMDFGGSGKNRYDMEFEGIIPMLKRHFRESTSEPVRRWAEAFMEIRLCPDCEGQRLKKESRWFKIAERNIAEVAQFDLGHLQQWFDQLEDQLNEQQRTIAKEIVKEIQMRIGFLLEVGLDYLTLDRPSRSLSGGESQRIRLATQIGSQLVGITYILDEPSIGLHQRDNQRLITALKQLVQTGNSVLVVEHDKDIMLAAHHIIDLGPGAGFHGGKVVGEGDPDSFMKQGSLTAKYLRDEKKIDIPAKRRKGSGKFITIKEASGNNLQQVTVKFPLAKFICVTGVSGSGKSTLINETLYPILNQHIYRSRKKPLAYKKINGLANLDKVIEINQSPIGRTPRSNPATYIGVFDEIRKLFAGLPEAKIRGYKPGRFSFNVKGGRCELCEGAGMKVIEMNFLPDVQVHCEKCLGKRYNRETLEIRYKGMSISDVLEMPVDKAVAFFEPIPKIYRKIKTLHDVGLGYITLGQSSTTLSGGEAQRVKLSEELSKKDTGRTFYILDEPTTGLHFEDIQMLLDVLNRLVDKGNTVLVIEHNIDVIKVADHVIDLGPEGGSGGGTVVCSGTPEEVARDPNSHTGNFLKQELKA